MHDALVIVNDGYFRNCDDLLKQEEYIFSGFQQLYYFAKVENLTHLARYANINSTDKEKNSKSFAYRFFDIEENCLRFKKHCSGKIAQKTIKKYDEIKKDPNLLDLL